MEEELILWHFNNFTFHARTLTMTWIVMAFILIFCFLGVRQLTSGKPGKMQNILEWVIDFVRGLISDNMSYDKGRPILSYLVTLIMFIFFSNMLGLIPNVTFNLLEHFGVEAGHFNKIFEGPSLMSPTADVNTTVGLALLSITLVLFLGIKHKGVHYFKHFFDPVFVFFPIHVIDLLAKPMTLAFRLFGNIFAGEVLIKVILKLPAGYGLWAFPAALPDTVWLAFSIFIGAIQAFVFTVLTTAYIGQAVAESH